METITLLPLYHRNLDCIGIYFEYSSALNRGLRKLSNANWSKTHGDLRIAHFLGLHAIQIVPLACYYLAKNAANVFIVAGL